MKRHILTLTVMTGLLAMTGGNVGAADKPILIGNLSGFTGTYSVMANQQKDSVEMAVNEINQAGGLLGRNVKVIHEDTMTSASIGTRKCEKLILEDKVDFIIGGLSSTTTLAEMKIVNKYNKLMMVPISQSVKITGEQKNKQTFRVCANPSITSGSLCRWMIDNLGKRFYLLTVDYEWGKSTSGQYHSNLRNMGGIIIGETYFPLGTKDFAPYFGKVKAAKPDVLFITAAGNDAISVVTQADRYGIKKMMDICGDGSLIAADILKAQGEAANGIITADYYSASLDTPENKAWVSRYKELYGSDPSKFSVSSYEAMMWLGQAIKQAGSTDTNKVIAALEGSTYHGPQGVKTMDPDSHQTSLTVYMIKAENGERKIFAKVE